MAARPACPKGDGPAYRLYAQVQNPETHRSTSVAMPAVFCGTPGFADGHGTLTVAKGQHGLVVLSAGAFAAQLRQSRTAVRAMLKSGVVRKGGTPVVKAKAKKGKPAAAKKAARPSSKPKAKKAPAKARGPMKADGAPALAG